MQKVPRQIKLHTTRVLPIVGLDVGAISSIALFSFGSGRRNSFEHQNKFFIFGTNNELRSPGGRFSTSPPSAILVRYAPFNSMTIITSNLSRLSLHDSSFKAIERIDNTIELTFDWSKLETFSEQNISEPIILGKTEMLVTGVHSEQFKIYEDDVNSNFSLQPLPDDIKKIVEVIISSNFDDSSRTAVFGGLNKESGKYQ